MCGFQELTGSLQDVFTQALEHIKGQETGMTALKLASLSLEGHTQVSVQTREQSISPSSHSFVNKELHMIFMGFFLASGLFRSSSFFFFLCT